jgi:glycosyltransferase involved in cell wall biosynthesis
MKIAHLIPRYFSKIGGLQVCVHNICERHAKMGIDVQIFCCDEPPQDLYFSYKVERIFDFKLVTSTYPLSKYLISHYIAKLQHTHNFDLWQINGGYPYGALLADFFMRNRIPAVLRCSGEDIQVSEEFSYGVRRNPRINRIVIENYKKYPAVIAITETVRAEYERIGMPQETIKLIPNGADIERIKKATDSDDIRRKHNIPINATIILSIGRNHQKKGYSLVPTIFRHVLDEGMDAFWIIIGKGTSRIDGLEVLGKDVGRLILVEEISSSGSKYHIPSGELIRYYKGADLFAMTSMLETFGIVLVEAMAAGLPIVCFDAPGVRDVMKNGYCGVMCKSGDTESFTRAILEIASRKDRAGFAKRCHEHARQYSWDVISDKYLLMYESLLLTNSATK